MIIEIVYNKYFIISIIYRLLCQGTSLSYINYGRTLARAKLLLFILFSDFAELYLKLAKYWKRNENRSFILVILKFHISIKNQSNSYLLDWF